MNCLNYWVRYVRKRDVKGGGIKKWVTAIYTKKIKEVLGKKECSF